MSQDIIPNLTSTPQNAPPAPVNPSSANPATAGAIAQANGPAVSSGSTSGLSDIDQLKRKYPKFYHQMMQGIAMNICKEMEHSQERLKKLMRESYR